MNRIQDLRVILNVSTWTFYDQVIGAAAQTPPARCTKNDWNKLHTWSMGELGKMKMVLLGAEVRGNKANKCKCTY